MVAVRADESGLQLEVLPAAAPICVCSEMRMSRQISFTGNADAKSSLALGMKIFRCGRVLPKGRSPIRRFQ